MTTNSIDLAELTPLPNDTPTKQSLTLLHKEINANTMSIPSNRDGGDHGHLALVLPAAHYLADTGHDFVTPVHPGPAPVIPTVATTAIITETN